MTLAWGSEPKKPYFPPAILATAHCIVDGPLEDHIQYIGIGAVIFRKSLMTISRGYDVAQRSDGLLMVQSKEVVESSRIVQPTREELSKLKVN